MNIPIWSPHSRHKTITWHFTPLKWCMQYKNEFQEVGFVFEVVSELHHSVAMPADISYV